MRASIVIVTDGRPKDVVRTLDSLQWLDRPSFEVIVVCGPTPDGTRERVAAWSDRVKIAHCGVRNISVARNMGIALATGEVVCFLDDDALPEPEWLGQIMSGFDDERVAAVGGIVWDHTGKSLQYAYSTANRAGRANWQAPGAANAFSFPLSDNTPYTQGCNSAFRRDVLVEMGGFDEEYEFYLDETDLCCRLVDAGWLVQQLPDAAVHHKFLPSEIRTPDRITRQRYAVVKNKIYYSFVNNIGHRTFDTTIRDAVRFIDEHNLDIVAHMEAGRMSPSEHKAYWKDVERAWSVGLQRGMSGKRRTIPPEELSEPPAFMPFPVLRPEGGARTYCFVTQEYPPDRTGGIGRYIHQLATGLAAKGHYIHVVSSCTSHDRVDFEDGVWVHRLVPQRTEEMQPDGWNMPAHVWDRAVRVREEVKQISSKRCVGAIYAPLWDSEAAAIIAARDLPVIVGLQTSLSHWLDSKPKERANEEFMSEFATPMIETETKVLRGAATVHAISEAIATDIASRYGLTFTEGRLHIAPLGIADERDAVALDPPEAPEGTVRLLFVGRLESRKGIQTLLSVVEQLAAERPWLRVDLVGNDALPGPDGETYRKAFEAHAPAETLSQVHFWGEVPAETLRGFYRAADVIVAPSLFESFGLVIVEAMMHGKPSVACEVGGMVEVGEAGTSTLFAEPGDDSSLAAALLLLIEDPERRARMGIAARRRYEKLFMPDHMIAAVQSMMDAWPSLANGGKR